MKRLLVAAAGLAGSLFVISPASAQPVDSVPTSVSTVVPASGSPPSVVLTAVRVQTPLPKVTVVSGDTLWGIGVRTHRTWQALASFNHIANPNLIYVGDVETVPPATYVAGPVSLPTPAPSYTPPVTHHVTYSAPARTYTPPAPAPVRSTYVAAPSGSFKACVEFRESTNGAGSSNLYGILNSTWSSLGRSGSAYTASPSEQSAAFDQLYAKDGASPWAPYDGC
jgi:LysM repeat protein